MSRRFALRRSAPRRMAVVCFSLAATLGGVAREPDPAVVEGPADAPIAGELSEEELAAIALFVEALREVEGKFVEKVDRRELVEAAIDGMLARYDPYADYLPPDRYARLKDDLDQEFGGVGVHLALRDSEIRVVSPVAGSPAHEAGVQPGDRLVAIDDVSLEGKSIEDAVDLLRGAPGSRVTLIAVAADGKEKHLTIERRAIAVPTVASDAEGESFLDRCGATRADRVGYLHVAAFNRRTVDELRLLLAALTAQNARGLVLDLRFNPGGLFNSGVETADLFLESGTIAALRGRGVEERVHEATADAADCDLPMVVLVNGATASAAEIVAAALQDHGRAVIVGERTYGKGVAQRILPLEGGESGVKLTSARYYRPSGAAIDRQRTGETEAPIEDEWGVRPSAGGEVVLSQAERLQLSVAFRERTLRSGDAMERTQDPDRQLEAACKILLERLGPGDASNEVSRPTSPSQDSSTPD